MRNHLVPEDRTNINGVTSRRWVRPAPSITKRTASVPSPTKRSDAAAVAQKQKLAMFSKFLDASNARAAGKPALSRKADQVMEEMSVHLDSFSPSAMNMMHAKIIDPETATAGMAHHVFSLCWERREDATPDNILEFVALSDYHRYNPAKHYIGSMAGYMEGIQCYDFNPDPVDFEDAESVRQNGTLLKFTMDIAESTPRMKNELLNDDSFMIRSERLAKMVFTNADMFEEQPERMANLIALANERGADAAVDLFFSADYDESSALVEGIL